MKIYYELPVLRYDFNNAKFIDFEFNEAISYCKLVYKDIKIFQKEYLSKLEFIPNLDELCLTLGNNFENAKPLNLDQISAIKDNDEKLIALFHYENYNIDNAKNKESFFKKYIEKLKSCIEEDDNQENGWSNFPASFSNLVSDKQPLTINSIKEFKIENVEEYIEFTVKNINKLVLNEATKYLVCNECDIKEIVLNENLKLLEATDNKISSIILNDNLEEVNLWNNPLEKIKIGKYLKELHLYHPKNFNIQIDNSIQNLDVNIYININ